jgi:hypothetical protein
VYEHHEEATVDSEGPYWYDLGVWYPRLNHAKVCPLLESHGRNEDILKQPSRAIAVFGIFSSLFYWIPIEERKIIYFLFFFNLASRIQFKGASA